MRQPTRLQAPSTGGAKLFVGNARCATSIENLDLVCEGCRRIVFCQDGDGTMAFQHDPAFRTGVPHRKVAPVAQRHPKQQNFFSPLFDFVDDHAAGSRC